MRRFARRERIGNDGHCRVAMFLDAMRAGITALTFVRQMAGERREMRVAGTPENLHVFHVFLFHQKFLDEKVGTRGFQRVGWEMTARVIVGVCLQRQRQSPQLSHAIVAVGFFLRQPESGQE